VKSRKKPFKESLVVLLVDDHELVRYGMRLIVETLGCTVLEAGTGEKSIELVRRQKVDLVFMDIALPGVDGITASSRLLRVDQQLRIIILTGLHMTAVPKSLLQSGIAGFMTKSSAAKELECAITQVLEGGMYLSNSIIRQMPLVSCHSAEGGEDSPFVDLSKREFQIVLLLMNGYRNGDASDQLLLSAKTISTYKRRAFEKLGVTNTAELMKLAMGWGFVEP